MHALYLLRLVQCVAYAFMASPLNHVRYPAARQYVTSRLYWRLFRLVTRYLAAAEMRDASRVQRVARRVGFLDFLSPEQ